MADKTAKARNRSGRTAEGAKKQTEGAVSKSKEQVEREALMAGMRGVLGEVPYAILGLGRVVVDAVGDVEATSLPERLRQTPGAVVSKVSKQGPNLKVGYLALVARGRGESLKPAGQEIADDTTEQTKATAKKTRTAPRQTKATAKKTRTARR
jgi:hypothetical protein